MKIVAFALTVLFSTACVHAFSGSIQLDPNVCTQISATVDNVTVECKNGDVTVQVLLAKRVWNESLLAAKEKHQ